MKRTIYDIDDDIRRIWDEAEVDEYGEVHLDFEKLDALNLEREVKVENAALLYREVVADERALGDEIERLKGRKEAVKKEKESLKEYLRYATGGEKVKTPKVTVFFKANESIEVDDVEKLPEEFIRTERTPVKSLLKDAMKNGEVFEGVRLVQSDSIIIR